MSLISDQLRLLRVLRNLDSESIKLVPQSVKICLANPFCAKYALKTLINVAVVISGQTSMLIYCETKSQITKI